MMTKIASLSLLISLTFLSVITHAIDQKANTERTWIATRTDTFDFSSKVSDLQLERAEYAYLSYNGTFYASTVYRKTSLGDAYADGWTLNYMNISSTWYNPRREECGDIAFSTRSIPNLNWDIIWFIFPGEMVEYQLDAELIRQEPGNSTQVNEETEF